MKTCPTCQRTHADEITLCPHDRTPLQTSTALMAGQVFDGQYEIASLIAQTRTGQLYRARKIHGGDHVALNVFRPELCREVAEWLRRFEREAQAALRFRHPNAVNIYDLRAEYIVMEHFEGQTLDEALRQHGRFKSPEVLAVMEPIARALDAALADGITCDFLTPADIMISRAESDLLSVKLLPLIFNRRAFEHRLGVLSTGGGLKTQVAAAPYVAPKLSGDAVPSSAAAESDAVYNLGVISYELLAGRKPYDGLTPVEIAQEQLTGHLTPLSELAPDIPSPVARVIERALAKKAKNRPANAGEFVSEFQAALGHNQKTTGSLLKGTVNSEVGEEISPYIDVDEGMSAYEERPELERDTNSRNAPAPSTDAPATDKPLYTDENVQFTVYQPEAVAPARWHTLLAFAHLSKPRTDAPPDEPEPLAEVKRIAARVLADETAEYDALKQNSLHAVPQKGEITFVPEIAGCEFNPPRQSFLWQKSVHKVEFEMRAGISLDGQMARGRLTVFLGSLILADVPLAIRVDSAAASVNAASVAPSVPASAAPYRKIFPSYSHKDRAVVEQIEHHARALGDKYLRDVTELRAGQDWQRWMREAIEAADMFQLFWSHNSMHSVYVRQEWEYALSLGRPNFVRPTYWELPLPESATENLPPDELRRLHFQHLRASTITYHPMPTGTGQAEALPERGLPTERGGRGEAVGYFEREEEIACSSCGARNLPKNAFCPKCGTALGTAAQSPAPTTSYSTAGVQGTPDVNDAMVVFWEKRKREASGDQLRPSPQPYSSQPSSNDERKRPLLWLGLLLLIALLVGVYLLIRLL